MKSIAQTFHELRKARRKALIPYLMSGFPDRRRFLELARTVQDLGADMLEIGVPFSDPLADGPVIQTAGQQALEQGATLEQTLEDAQALATRRPDLPLVLMSYFNPLQAYGLERLAARSREAGVRGWIVPDRDLDRPQEVLKPARVAGVDVVPLLAPTTPKDRFGAVLRGARGFVYLVSITGVTGAAMEVGQDLGPYVGRVRAHTALPLCVGFGISRGDQARAAAIHADGVIVGSALLAPFLDGTFEEGARQMNRCLQDIRSALDSR